MKKSLYLIALGLLPGKVFSQANPTDLKASQSVSTATTISADSTKKKNAQGVLNVEFDICEGSINKISYMLCKKASDAYIADEKQDIEPVHVFLQNEGNSYTEYVVEGASISNGFGQHGGGLSNSISSNVTIEQIHERIFKYSQGKTVYAQGNNAKGENIDVFYHPGAQADSAIEGFVKTSIARGVVGNVKEAQSVRIKLLGDSTIADVARDALQLYAATNNNDDKWFAMLKEQNIFSASTALRRKQMITLFAANPGVGEKMREAMESYLKGAPRPNTLAEEFLADIKSAIVAIQNNKQR